MERRGGARVLLAKVGLDGHDRGVTLVGMALRDAGFEVIYLGRHWTPDQIAATSVQEDVDVVGLSSLSDAHRVLVPRVVKELRKQGSKAPVVLGGFIQDEDIPTLRRQGVEAVFGIGSRLTDVVKYFEARFAP